MVSTQEDNNHYPIFAITEQEWEARKSDCSGFVRAVAHDAGIPLNGLANHLVDEWNIDPTWIKLGHDYLRASEMAAHGYLVVAGKKEEGHGHVVIVVPSRPHGVAMGYWGRLGGVGFRNKGLNFARRHADLATVEYFARSAPNLEPKQ